jgi:hypothetical protein
MNYANFITCAKVHGEMQTYVAFSTLEGDWYNQPNWSLKETLRIAWTTHLLFYTGKISRHIEVTCSTPSGHSWTVLQ